MFKKFFKLGEDNQLLLIIAIFVILFALFWPRDRPLAGLTFAANLGNLGGKVQLEALETLDESFDQKTFALFYAPWCPHCKSCMPHWNNLEKMNKTDINIVKIDCDANPEMAQKFGIQGYPTIKFLPYGLNNPKNMIDYDGPRTGEAFLAFIANK